MKLIRSLPTEKITALIDIFEKAHTRDSQIFLFGNGGNAASASHLACDLGKGASDVLKKRFRVITLNDNAAVFGDPGSMPKHAVTMGIGTIMEARQIVLLAFGPAKVRAVMEMIEGPLAAVCPGSALQEHPRTTVVLDGNSSAGLQYLDHYRWIESHKLAWQRYD